MSGMKMDRRELLSMGAASAMSAGIGTSAEAKVSGDRAGRRGRSDYFPPNLHIRDYLSLEARKITAGALSDFKDAATWRKLYPQKRHHFLDMMGCSDLKPYAERSKVPFTVTGVLDRPGYRIEKLYYESLSNLFVTANLYIPTAETIAKNANPKSKAQNPKLPAVLYVCGHSNQQKHAYQAHPRRFAELGFVTLIVETVQLGEAHGYHHGCYREGWWDWYSRGYTPAGIEMFNGIRGLDLLAQRPEVDPERLGVTGISGGGAATWWIAAGDERIKVAAPVCGTATVESHIYDRTIDGHCDCMWWINTQRWDLADMGGLIAPRPLMIASADKDGIFTIESIRKVHSQVAGLYKKLGKPENLRLVETPGGHSYHEKSRTAIFSWFAKHLQSREISPESIGDLDETPARQEPEPELRVYVKGEPAGNRVPTIHDGFVKLAALPMIESQSDLNRERSRVLAALKEQTFGAFPKNPPPLDVKEEYILDGDSGTRFAFTSEEGWRLHGIKTLPRGGKESYVSIVGLRMPGENRNETEGFVGRVGPAGSRIVIEPRGTGEMGWNDDLNWHLRRATAWTGRTIASMRVWDTLRALEAVRKLSLIDPGNVSLAARGEMCVVALYAALLDGKIKKLYLENPPATQNAPSQKDGKGPAIEMLNVLRITDLPVVAGLVYPTEVEVTGDFPATYGWAQDVYSKLGAAASFKKG